MLSPNYYFRGECVSQQHYTSVAGVFVFNRPDDIQSHTSAIATATEYSVALRKSGLAKQTEIRPQLFKSLTLSNG
jgi:hypothetical protein